MFSIAIDTPRSARVRRESYVGPWLPEPLVDGRGPDPADHIGGCLSPALLPGTAIQQPLHGVLGVARFLLGLLRRSTGVGARLELTHANGHPAALAVGPSGELLGVLAIDVVHGRVAALRNQINPDNSPTSATLRA